MKITFILLCFFAWVLADNILLWNKHRRLAFEDFHGDTLVASKYSASSYIHMTIKFKHNQDSGIIRYSIYPYFVKDSSWIKVNDTCLLIHEEGHFDLGEIQARMIRKYLENLSDFDIIKVKSRISELNGKMYSMDSVYDLESDHGRNTRKQNLWNNRIDHMLDSLKDFQSPTGIVFLK